VFGSNVFNLFLCHGKGPSEYDLCLSYLDNIASSVPQVKWEQFQGVHTPNLDASMNPTSHTGAVSINCFSTTSSGQSQEEPMINLLVPMDSSSPEQSQGDYLSDQVKIMEMQAVMSDATNGYDILLFPLYNVVL